MQMPIFAKNYNFIMENETTNIPLEENKKEEKCECKKCCHCFYHILNIISVLGVIVLFVLYFTGRSSCGSGLKKSGNSSTIVAYVNSDTIMEHYDLVQELKSKIEAKEKLANDSFNMQQQNFEAEVNEYQKNVQANKLSIAQAQATEKYLGQKQQNLAALKEELTQKLSNDELKMNGELIDSIMNFLKRYNRKHNYDYVFGFAKGSNILFANDSLDITKEVLKDINKEYKENHSGK
jgi:outer membrane protein